MNVARVLYPVEVLGPGKRIGIWLAGCEHHCKGCSNPELWEKRPEYEISVDEFVSLLKTSFECRPVDGFVITGGDPFYQSEELSKFLDRIQDWSHDILVYTGFTYQELLSAGDMSIDRCLKKIGVLIDGRYEEALNDGIPLRGSSNQDIIFLRPQLQPAYERYMRENGNQIQNFALKDGIVSVGIHHKGFLDELEARVGEKGLTSKNGKL